MKRWYLVALAGIVIAAAAIPVLAMAGPGGGPGQGPMRGPGFGPPWAATGTPAPDAATAPWTGGPPAGPRGRGFGGPGLGPMWTSGQPGQASPMFAVMSGQRDQVHAAVATALGITPDEVTAAVRSGKTMPDLAKEKGIPVDDVMAKAKAAREAYINEQVAAGKLTKEQGDLLLSRPGPGGADCQAGGGPRGGPGPGGRMGRGFGPPGSPNR